jgi:hypothetical protein
MYHVGGEATTRQSVVGLYQAFASLDCQCLPTKRGLIPLTRDTLVGTSIISATTAIHIDEPWYGVIITTT